MHWNATKKKFFMRREKNLVTLSVGARSVLPQRWKKMETLETPSVVIFSSFANFLVLHAIFCTSLRIFATQKKYYIFARFCAFFARVFCANLSDSKLSLCYFFGFARNFLHNVANFWTFFLCFCKILYFFAIFCSFLQFYVYFCTRFLC